MNQIPDNKSSKSENLGAQNNMRLEDENLRDEFFDKAIKDLNWINDNISVTLSDINVYEQSYRLTCYVRRFGELFGYVKLVSLLEPTEKILNYMRTSTTGDRSSTEYVVKISAQAAIDLLCAMVEKKICEIDVEELISECEHYVASIVNYEQNSSDKNQLNSVASCGSSQNNQRTKSEPPIVETTYKEITAEDRTKEYQEFIENISQDSNTSDLVGEYCIEASENLDRMAELLLVMESGERDPSSINDLFRSIHTIKGGARLLSIKKIEDISHQLEEMLDSVRKNQIQLDDDIIDITIDGTKIISLMINEIRSSTNIKTDIAPLISKVTSKLNNKNLSSKLENNVHFVSLEETISRPPLKDESLRVSTVKLDEMLNTASEVYVTRIRLKTDIDNISRALKELQQLQIIPSKISDTSISAYDEITCSATSLKAPRIIAQTNEQGLQNSAPHYVRKISSDQVNALNSDEQEIDLNLRLRKLDLLQKQIQEDVSTLERLSGRLQDSAMSFRMVPISQLFARFPILVRDMAKQLGKRVKVDLIGGDTELDKVLINNLTDPLIHILRNAIDHGIENDNQRLLAGKESIGTILLSARYEGSYAVIRIEDDGRGIDREKIAKKAINCGLRTIDQIEKCNDDELLSLIFEPGFSTASVITEVSGRGVGMDVVRSSVQKMQGTISIESELGAGTRFIIKLPLTLAIIGIVLVQEHGLKFAIPILNIVEVISVDLNEIEIINGKRIIKLRDQIIPISCLSEILGISNGIRELATLSIVIITDGTQKAGLIVAATLGRQDVLIKQYGSLIQKLPYMMGCTILSDNSLIPVINITEILNSPSRSISDVIKTDMIDMISIRQVHQILIVDDSSLQRRRVSSALEQAGYKVVCAEDGFQALSELRKHKFSACCVDLIMPIIDGFEFVEKVREIPNRSDLPIYMMSGRRLESEYEIRRLENLNINKFLHKPFDVNNLIAEIDHCLINNSPHILDSGVFN